MFCLFVGALYKWNVTKTKFLCAFKCHWRIKYPCIFVFIYCISSLLLLLLYCVYYNSSPGGFYLSKLNISFMYLFILFIHSFIHMYYFAYLFVVTVVSGCRCGTIYSCIWEMSHVSGILCLPASGIFPLCLSSKLSSRLHRLDGLFRKSM